jgi:hypothetical protein
MIDLLNPITNSSSATLLSRTVCVIEDCGMPRAARIISTNLASDLIYQAKANPTMSRKAVEGRVPSALAKNGNLFLEW